MKIILISFAVYLGISALLILINAIYSGKVIKRLMVNALLGLFVLALVNITKNLTGIYININPTTVIGISVFSVPAVIGFLLLNVIVL